MLGSWELGPVSGYSGVKNILIDYTKVKGSVDLQNYPFLFKESSQTYLKTTGNGGDITNSNGYDIIFTDENNIQLDHEIEYYDGGSGAGIFIAWVRIPILRASKNTKIRVHYGNSSISVSQENKTGVWDFNYKGVWHLKESGVGTASEFKDSTSNNNHGQGGPGSTFFELQRQSIINGIDSAQAEATGWDAVVKAGLGVNTVVRTSDTRCTITLEAFPTYNITADETITATIPAAALVTSGSPIVAIPTFKVKRTYSVNLEATYSVVSTGGTDWATNLVSSGQWQDEYYRSGIDFDTSSIPDNAVITKLSLQMRTDEISSSPPNNDVTGLSQTAYKYHITDDDPAGLGSDADGSDYLYNSSVYDGNGIHTAELSSTARTDLQNQLGDDWFSIGFTGTTESGNEYRDFKRYNEDDPPTLIIEYQLPDADLSGTLADGSLETEIVAGGQTLIITLTGDTWVSTVGQDNAITTALIAGIDSAQSEGTGWDAVVKANMDYNDITRNSDTVVTITLGAEATYNITANEVITVTIPATALTSGVALEANQKFPVIATGVVSAIINGTVKGVWEGDIVSGGETIIIDLIGDTWVPDIPLPTPTRELSDKIGYAQHFDGSDDYITIPDSASLSFTYPNITVMALVKLDTDQTGERAAIRKEVQWSLELFPTDNHTRNLVGTNGVTGWTTANDESYTINADTWYLLAFTYDGFVLKQYINGIQVGSDHGVSGYIIDNSNAVAIGANTGGATLNFDGIIDEVRVSDLVRTDAWLRTVSNNILSPSIFYSVSDI